MKNPILLAAIGIAASLQLVSAQDHGHLNVGAIGVNQNDPLIFDNGADFDVASDYVKTLTLATNGTYAGYYQGGITLTALAATSAYGGPVPNAPALGSWIFAQLVSVEGPAGGAFSFWESGATNPTVTLLSGTTGTNLWRLSENDGSPETDPYGHIHGRRFTATKPGIYTVGFRAMDLSTNGSTHGPIHTSSDVLKVCFQAGVNVKGVSLLDGAAHVKFSAPAGNSWALEAAGSLNPAAEWNQVGDAVAGDDRFHEVSEPEIGDGQRFYRIRVVVP